MSADNTIIILELTDQCRVVEMGNAEDIYWSNEIKGYKDQPVSTRLFERFHSAKILSDKKEAFDYADKLYNETGYVEYGIQKIRVNKVWNDIVLETLEESEKELDTGSFLLYTLYEDEKQEVDMSNNFIKIDSPVEKNFSVNEENKIYWYLEDDFMHEDNTIYKLSPPSFPHDCYIISSKNVEGLKNSPISYMFKNLREDKERFDKFFERKFFPILLEMKNNNADN